MMPEQNVNVKETGRTKLPTEDRQKFPGISVSGRWSTKAEDGARNKNEDSKAA